MHAYLITYAFADYIQDIFDPVQFSNSNKEAEEAVYMHFSRLLNEAEGTYLLAIFGLTTLVIS